MLFFAAFADNLVRYLEGTEDSFWFWGLSGRLEGTCPDSRGNKNGVTSG